MAHNFLEPGCTVYVWKPRGIMRGLFGSALGYTTARVGHSSIKVSDGTGDFVYLSFWPADKPEDLPSAPSLSRERGIANINRVLERGGHDPKIFGTTMGHVVTTGVVDGDAEHEHGKPDEKFRFVHGLNWKIMIDTARILKTECTTYNLKNKNCSHAVARVLESGNPPLKVPMVGTFTSLWQPSDVSAYCRKLITEINKTYPGSGMEKKSGAWV